MNLYIKELTLCTNHKTTETFCFSRRLSVVESTQILADVLECVLGNLSAKKYDKTYSFTAKVVIDTLYLVQGEKIKGEREWQIKVEKQGKGIISTKEYFDFIQIGMEQQEMSRFSRTNQHVFPRQLKHYKDQMNYYSPGEFAKRTNGFGEMRRFRKLLTDYIKAFSPKRLPTPDDRYLYLLQEGDFAVVDADMNNSVPLMNAGRVLYQYLCFLSLNEFWRLAEKERNYHAVHHPLLIYHFMEQMTTDVNVEEVLRQTNAMKRQSFLFVSKECCPTRFDVKKTVDF